jgi:hypothetical protein
MLRLDLLLIAATTIFFVSPLHAVCPYPEEVSVPDGATASNDEMVNGQTLVKQFMAEMEDYLDCLDREEATIAEKQTPDAKDLHVQRHNAAVDAMEKMAAEFNEEIRAYKTANNN